MKPIIPWILFLWICSVSAQTFQVRTEVKTVAGQLQMKRVFVTTDSGKYTLLAPPGYQMSNVAKNRMLYFSHPDTYAQITLSWHRPAEEEAAEIKALSDSFQRSRQNDAGAPSDAPDDEPVGSALIVKREESNQTPASQEARLKAVEAFYRAKLLQTYSGAVIRDEFVVHADKHVGPGFLVERSKPADSLSQFVYIPIDNEILIATLVVSPDNMPRVEDALGNLLMTVVAAGKGDKLDVSGIPGKI